MSNIGKPERETQDRVICLYSTLCNAAHERGSISAALDCVNGGRSYRVE